MEVRKGDALRLPKGYKQTEVGVIPEDWEVKSLSEVTTLMTNGFVGVATTHYSNDDSDILYIQGYNVEENGYNFRGIKYVTKAFHKLHQKSCLQENDLLTIQTGDVGLTTIVPKQLVGSNCHALIITRFKKGKIIPKFYSYYFNSSQGRARLKEIETGTTMKHINVGDLLQFEIPIPPTKSEQTAIATALSDADALITSLEKLIEKKRAIKQGAMQELLKPKEGWEVKEFQNIVDKFIDYRGVTPKKLGMDWGGGEIPALSANNVQMGLVDFSKECYMGSLDLYKRWMRNGDCSKNDILLTMEAPLGNIAFIPDEERYILSQRTILIKPVESVDKIFLRYLLMSSSFQKMLIENASGTTALGIQRKKLEKLDISYPSQKSEQTHIATILSDMDAEITALEQKLAKYKQIKQGMMQELLTGRIRLVENV